MRLFARLEQEQKSCLNCGSYFIRVPKRVKVAENLVVYDLNTELYSRTDPLETSICVGTFLFGFFEFNFLLQNSLHKPVLMFFGLAISPLHHGICFNRSFTFDILIAVDCIVMEDFKILGMGIK